MYEAETIEYSIEETIKLAFPEAPETMVAIAKCESSLRQFELDGVTALKGRASSDVGVFQINYVHWERAERLGIDLHTLEGNIAFAKLLFDNRGTGDWYMSKHCWGGV